MITGPRSRLSPRCLIAMLMMVALFVMTVPGVAQFRGPGMRAARPSFRNVKRGPKKPKPAEGEPSPVTQADAIIAAPVEGSNDAALIELTKQRLDKELASLNRQRAADGKPALPEVDHTKPNALVDLAHYGFYHFQTGPARFIALHLTIENPTEEPLTITREHVAVKIDGDNRPLADLPAGLNLSFAYGNQHHNLQQPQQFKEFKVPAKGVAAGWLLSPGLPMSSEVPPIELAVKLGGRSLDINVTESQRAMLHLETQTLGPRGCLKLLTVRGFLNSINLQSLVSVLEHETEQKVVRFVVQWTPESAAPDQQLSQWLVQAVMQAGSGRPVNDQYPTLPASIREFHLVTIPSHNFPGMEQFGRAPGGTRMHASLPDAVSAALRTSYLALKPSEIIHEIQTGDPLARAAALRHGSSRLPGDGLQVVLPFLEDENPDLRLAAVRALNQFGEPAALDALTELARQSSDPLSQAAVESLASSRFATAQARVLDLLRSSEGEAKKQLMQVLARHPRPQWSEQIYEYVTDPAQKLPVDGVRALLQVGHPRLIDVLEACLKSDQAEPRELAFPILAQRSDLRSERLASAYALAQLEKQPPDGTVIQFLHRTKLPQALPLLLKHLDSSNDKQQILQLLGQIGDESISLEIAKRYPNLKNHEKNMALNSLRMLRYPQFQQLAAEALVSTDVGLVNQATQGLMQDGTPQAAQLLIAALEKQTNQSALHQIIMALGNIGTPEARAQLLKARESNNQHLKNPAIAALQNLYQRSPGYQYIYQAQEHMRQKKWSEALEFYEMSLQIDPELPEALAGRANVKQRLGKAAEAIKDFEKAYELDPYNHLAVPGLAVVRVQAGKIDEGLKIITDRRDRYQHDPVFLYNSACVYAQAFDQAKQQKELPEREKRMEEYRQKAVAELQLAVTRGFGDFDFAREDPDLKVLADDPEFKKLVGDRPAKKEPDKDKPADATITQ